MGHLFYSELGGTAGSNILTNSDSDLAKFINIQSYVYWSGSGTAQLSGPTYGWYFRTLDGYQSADLESTELSAWAVRPGDVAAAPPPGNNVPEPATLLLLGLGLAGLGWARRRG